MLVINNVYGHGYTGPDIARLERLGFSLRPQASIYMGSQVCRFIDFARGPCLEMIEVEDHQAYRDFVPDGMVPYCPGISLALPDESRGTLDDIADEFYQLHPYMLHVNYDGSLDPPGPGWNYVNFTIPLVQNVFIWLTGCDEPRPAEATITSHPNGVEGVTGLVFTLDAGRLRGLRYLLEAPSMDDAPPGNSVLPDGVLPDGVLADGGGTLIWPADILDDLPHRPDKAFPLAAIVLKAASLDTFAAFRDEVRAVTFGGQPAIRIETNPLSWDLVITA